MACGKINGIPVSNLSVAKDTVIKNITVKNLNVATGTDIKVICCVYERGMLCGITSQVFTTESGTSEYSVDLSPVMFKPGRTLKIFVEPADSSLSATTPKLELP